MGTSNLDASGKVIRAAAGYDGMESTYDEAGRNSQALGEKAESFRKVYKK